MPVFQPEGESFQVGTFSQAGIPSKETVYETVGQDFAQEDPEHPVRIDAMASGVGFYFRP